MDVVLVALGSGIAVGLSVATHYWRMWKIATLAHESASQRADMAEERERSNWGMFQKAVEQNSSLAQQLATLRVEHGAVPEERAFEVSEEWVPYSDDLEQFLQGIESPEALEIVEEEVEAMRVGGKSDTEILARLRLGD